MSDLETKQQYLRSEIIDQGYDPNDFSAFMGTIRGEDALDLDKWTFDDLQTVVAQFKAQYSQNQNQEQNQEQNQDQNQEQNQQEQETPNQNENQDNNQENPNVPTVKEEHIEGPSKNSSDDSFPKDAFDNYEQIIKTEKLVNNDITEQNNLSIIISNPIKVNTGFFSSSYYQYDVQTNPVGYKVVRKLSDFTFLYETLPLINPAVFNPVLPHFEFGLKDDSPKKMLYIQNYMNSLVEEKFFRTLPIVFQFLTEPQDKWNKLRINTYSKMKPYTLTKMPTLEGEFHINVNKAEDSKGMNIKTEINKKTEAYDNLNIAMDELLSTMEKLSTCFKMLAKSLFDLTNSHKENEVLFNFFKRLCSISKIRSKDYIRERDFLRDELKYFFKFLNKENVSYLKKYDEFKSARDEYKSRYEKVKKLPNRTPKDLETIKILRRDYGLQLLMINTEYKKLLGRQANRTIMQFNKYNNNKDLLLQNFNNCIKMLDINGDQNYSRGLSDSIKKEDDQGKEQEQPEFTTQNSQSSIDQ